MPSLLVRNGAPIGRSAKVPKVPGMEHRETIEGLLKWSQRRHPIVRGQRNANLYKLAAAFNEYGVPKADALAVCAGFQDLSGPDPFTAGEIAQAVESAYKRTPHGTKRWTPRSTYTEAPGPVPPVPPAPPPEDRVQAFVRRHHLEHFVEIMDLDLDRARIVALPPQGAGDKAAEIERHSVNAPKGQQDAST
jgi:hypothetical protein